MKKYFFFFACVLGLFIAPFLSTETAQAHCSGNCCDEKIWSCTVNITVNGQTETCTASNHRVTGHCGGGSQQ